MNFGFGNIGYRASGAEPRAKSKGQRARTRRPMLPGPALYALCVLLLALFSLMNAIPVQAQGQLKEDQAKVVDRDEEGKATKLSFFNLVNVDIHQILKFMSDETDLTVIASEKVKGKITLVNLKDITVNEALESIKTALNTLGFTTVRVNKTIVIIPLEDAKTKPVRVQIGSDPEQIESTDEMIT